MIYILFFLIRRRHADRIIGFIEENIVKETLKEHYDVISINNV